MKTAAKCIILITAFLLTIPSVAYPQFRDRRDDGRAYAYHAGYNAGYRDGQRQGMADFRFHRRFNYKTWDYNHPDRLSRPEFRFQGDFKRGYREGYRDGYQSAHRGYFRYWR